MRTSANKSYRTFTGGLITEASPLTYPESASLDEDNTIIFKKGNRTRRLGFQGEDNFLQSSYSITASQLENGAEIDEHSWEAVNETGDTDLLVQRVGDFVYFYDHQDTELSRNLLPFSIDLRVYALNNSVEVFNSEISFANGRGLLFIVGERINPISVEFIPETNSIEVRRINIVIRDFIGVDDGLANDFEPTTLTAEHLYNLRNQGWVTPAKKETDFDATGNVGTPGIFTQISRGFTGFSDLTETYADTSSPIEAYFNSQGVYPGNNKQWWLGRLEVDKLDDDDPEVVLLQAGEFDPELLCDTYVGNTRAARGHYLLDAFNKDLSEVSGIAGLPTDTSTNRPNSVAFYSGRVWYGHESDVYYSQTLEDHRQAGLCYQEADPTSEVISDLIATDGGIIPIPEAHNIKRLYSLGGGLLVFADNGIWFVGGGSGNGFDATNVAVAKVTSNGLLGRNTLIEADGIIYWWSAAGIMSLSQQSGLFGAQDGAFDRANISELTIQSYYNNCIPPQTKQHAKGVYDPIRGVVKWLFSDQELNGYRNFYNKILNLDTVLNAFYPWTVSSELGRPYITGVFRRVNVRQILTPGFVTQKGPDTFSTFLNYSFVCLNGSSYNLSYGDFSGQEFVDFPHSETGYEYLSFLETGYEVLEDLMRDKQQNYVYWYFRRTDDTLEDGGIGSSCFVQTKWDWSNSEVSKRWSRRVQAYRVTERHKHAAVVATKHKVRGQGRSIQIRFESDARGKTFDLLGWAAHFTGETVV